MRSEREQSIAFVEGLSCSGKTTVLKNIASQEIASIFKRWPHELKNPTVSFFLEQDEEKLTRAKKTKATRVLVDRGPLSTLTFYSVMEEQRKISAHPVYRWYIDGLVSGSLYRPHYYVFLDIRPEESIKRAKKAGRTIDENNMWLLFPQRIEDWYARLFKTFEYATPVFRIDASRSIPEVTTDFRNLIDSLK